METVNTETETTASGYEYTHADGTVQHVESAEQARSVCPALGKMAIEQANLLLELSAIGQGILDKQKEQQSESSQDSAAEDQLTAPVAETKTPGTTNQPESNIYSDTSGYRPLETIKTEQPKPKIDTGDVDTLTKSSPEPAPNDVAKTPSETRPQNIPEKLPVQAKSTNHEETTKIEQPAENIPEIIEILPVLEDSVDVSDTEVTEDEPYTPDLIPIPLEIPVEEITDNIEKTQEIIVTPSQEIAPKRTDKEPNKPPKTEIATAKPTPSEHETGEVTPINAHEKSHDVIPVNEPSPAEVSEYSKPETKPVAETIVEQVAKLADEQIDTDDILGSPVINDIVELAHDLQESIETNASDEQIESLKIELTVKLTLLFEELGIEIEPKEIEKLIIEITKNTSEPTELTEYLPIDAVDLEHSGTHEVKRSLSQFISDSTDAAERDIKQFIGEIVLRHIVAES